ncbi:hypothetical protein [Pseudoruegeria sp. HB172150]|uniref:hypothetical protein n=1 Tax=Pseudoruegeria sp. HB172150 TaxID=2721164 RepID=UPI001558150C|nr:hypothetical protein [Pseudoruegeria sp. HB172150]
MPFKRIGAAALAAACLALTATAQEFDPSLGIEALAVTEGGRILVRNGENAFGCALTATDASAELSDCQLREATGDDAEALLAKLSESDWREMVRLTLLRADCKISVFAGLEDVLAQAAEEHGASPDVVERMRASLADKAAQAVAQMMRSGMLSVRDGEYVLDNCP